ncbi:MAG: hypothetical protein J6A75_11660 [Lachnospiraceae bacterium]|nr:hypothetical protein [Lachnospiraceae bacterium]
MNLTRCPKGHFFDKEKYTACPQCNENEVDSDLTEVFDESADIMAGNAQAGNRTAAGGAINFFGGYGTTVTEEPSTLEIEHQQSDVTVPLMQQPQTNDMTVPLMQQPQTNDITVPLTQQPQVNNVTVPFTQQNYGAGVTEAEDDDHTVGFFDMDFGVSSQSTVPLYQTSSTPQPTVTQNMQSTASAAPAYRPVNKVTTPCVGWLIALNGSHKGTDFRLKVGKNFIGRNPQMDVALTEDKSVSRDKHATVIYEPKAHIYMMQPGDTSSLVYRNDEVVLNPIKIEAYDRITIGEVELLFMPLCGEKFNWSDWLKENKKDEE